MDTVDLHSVRGHVVLESDVRGVIYDDHNLVLDLATELIVRAVLGADRIANVAFASAGIAAAPGLRSIPGIVATIPVAGQPARGSRDGRNTLGVWRGVWTPSAPASYDMIALLTANMSPFAVASFPAVSIAAAESVAVRWTIFFRD